MPSWLTIIIQLLPLILQILQQLFPPKPSSITVGPIQKRLIARLAGRMQAFIDQAKAAGYVSDSDIGAAVAADDELGAVVG